VLAQKRMMGGYMNGYMSVGFGEGMRDMSASMGGMGGMGGMCATPMGGFMASMVAPFPPMGVGHGGAMGDGTGGIGSYTTTNPTDISHEGEARQEDANDGNGGHGEDVA
jgi:hypothetical protein